MNAGGRCKLPKVPVQVRVLLLLLLLLSLFVLKPTFAAIAWKHRGYSCAKKKSGTVRDKLVADFFGAPCTYCTVH